MDLLSLKLRIADRHARALLRDGDGERGADFTGERFERVLLAGAPLVQEVARRAGVPSAGVRPGVRAISIDATARVVRASLVGSALGLGAAFRDWPALAPLIQPLVRAALNEASPPRPELDSTPSEAAFWDARYHGGHDGWELGRPTPPLARWFAAHSPRGRRALVVGCGRGHEARMLAALGADVVAIDLSPEAIAAAREILLRAPAPTSTAAAPSTAVAEGSLELRVRDLFDLPRDPERYDLVVEHTCYCAIEPRRRDEYARVMAEVVVPGGELVALFWAHGRPGGPPFGATRGELLTRFAPAFSVEESSVPVDSVAPRAGEELLVRLRRA